MLSGFYCTAYSELCGSSLQEFWSPVVDLMAWTVTLTLHISGSSNLSFLPHCCAPPPCPTTLALMNKAVWLQYKSVIWLNATSKDVTVTDFDLKSIALRSVSSFQSFYILSCQILGNFITCILQNPTTLDGLALYNNSHVTLLSLSWSQIYGGVTAKE